MKFCFPFIIVLISLGCSENTNKRNDLKTISTIETSPLDTSNEKSIVDIDGQTRYKQQDKYPSTDQTSQNSKYIQRYSSTPDVKSFSLVGFYAIGNLSVEDFVDKINFGSRNEISQDLIGFYSLGDLEPREFIRKANDGIKNNIPVKYSGHYAIGNLGPTNFIKKINDGIRNGVPETLVGFYVISNLNWKEFSRKINRCSKAVPKDYLGFYLAGNLNEEQFIEKIKHGKRHNL